MKYDMGVISKLMVIYIYIYIHIYIQLMMKLCFDCKNMLN